MSKITAEVKFGNDVKELDEWQRQANPWTVTLRYQGRQMTVPFFTGEAWTREPTAADVLECLVSDAQGVEFSSFEEWCDDMGFDSDSRKAERTYKALEVEERKLRAFFRGVLWETIEKATTDDGDLRRDDDGNVVVH